MSKFFLSLLTPFLLFGGELQSLSKNLKSEALLSYECHHFREFNYRVEFIYYTKIFNEFPIKIDLKKSKTLVKSNQSQFYKFSDSKKRVRVYFGENFENIFGSRKQINIECLSDRDELFINRYYRKQERRKEDLKRYKLNRVSKYHKFN